MIQLYEDQQEFIDKLRGSLRLGHKSILGVAAPAFGKTVVAGHIISTIAGRGGSVWFVVHRKNLLRQTSHSFWRAKIEHGLMTSGKSRSRMPVQVGTIGTVFSRMEHLDPPAVLFVDEAHLSRGNMFETVIKWVKDAGGIVIGLTGTPERLDQKPLGYLFTDMVEARDVQWLIQQGRLSDYEMYTTPVMPDLSGIKNSSGDYNQKDLSVAMDKSVITGDAVSHYRALADGLIAVAYCVSVAHSKSVTAQFNAAGVPAVHVDADTTEAELKEACEGLASGRYKVLVNCELVIEGFDLSSQVGADITIECCILLRPTKSKARYLQMVYRAMRKKPNPAIILDHAGCYQLHGLPDDIHEWSLEGKKKGARKSDQDETKITQCKKCYFVFRPGVNECPKCGEKIPVSNRELEIVEGTLEKVEEAAQRKEQRLEQGRAKSLDELIMLGMRKGLKNPHGWAANVAAGREGRKAGGKDYAEAKRAYIALQQPERYEVSPL